MILNILTILSKAWALSFSSDGYGNGFILRNSCFPAAFPVTTVHIYELAIGYSAVPERLSTKKGTRTQQSLN